MYNSKFLTLNRALEKAERFRINNNLPSETTAQLVELTNLIEPKLLKFHSDVQKVKEDNNLSESGKQKEINQLKENIAAELEALERTEAFEEKIYQFEVELNQRAATVRTKNFEQQSEGGFADNLAAMEIRSHLAQLEEKAKQKHQKYSGIKEFESPISKIFEEACTNYQPHHEMALRAVTDAPWPLKLLPQEKIQTGLEKIKAVISPDVANAVTYQRALKELHAGILETAKGITQHPDKQAVIQDQKILVADGVAS